MIGKGCGKLGVGKDDLVKPIPRHVRACLHFKIGKIKTLLWALEEDVSRKTGN